eukprot:358715-Chlamydomonas_euryale.AAC.8
MEDTGHTTALSLSAAQTREPGSPTFFCAPAKYQGQGSQHLSVRRTNIRARAPNIFLCTGLKSGAVLGGFVPGSTDLVSAAW